MNGKVWVLGRQTAVSDQLISANSEAVFAKYSQTVFSLPLYGCIDLCSNHLSI